MDSNLESIDPDIHIFNSSHSYSCYTANEFNVEFVNPTGFSLIHFNARSLQKSFDEMAEFLLLLKHSFSIIAISETWISGTPLIPFKLPGYNFVNVNRHRGRGGGVGLFISDSIDFIINTDVVQTEEERDCCESLFIDFVNKNIKHSVGVIYKKPSCNNETFFEYYNRLIATVSSERKNLYVLGDFNIDLMKCPLDHNASNFVDINSSFGLFPLINSPTRVTPSSSTLIDNIFTNVLDSHLDCGCLCVDITDHLPIFLLTNIELSKKRKKLPNLGRNISTEGINSLNNELCNTDWSPVYSALDVDDSYNTLLSIFIPLLDKHLPFKKKKVFINKIRKPWISPKLFRCIKRKNELYKIFLNNKSPVNENKYKRYRNKVTKLVRKAKKKYYCKTFRESKNDVKQTWNVINSVLRKSEKSVPSYFTCDSKKVDDPQTIANEFNSYFDNCCATALESMPPLESSCNHTPDTYLTDNCQQSIFLNPIKESEIVEICKLLKSSNSYDFNYLNVNILKKIHSIIKPLVYIFNKSIETGSVPTKFKIAKVVPVYKKGDSHLLKNYRPISILPCFSKLIEKCIFNRVYSFLCNNDILSKSQYGFRRNHSTTHALIDLQDKIISAIDKNNFGLGIFMDLSKAFDIVDHEILLYKLKHYGIRGTALKWFTSYLNNRSQYTFFANCSSNKSQIKHGVPQGSILGPLLFLLYINDITNSSEKLEFVLYADDTTLFYTQSNVENLKENVEYELKKVTKWFRVNKLLVNYDKTHFVPFQNRCSNISDALDNIVLTIDCKSLNKCNHVTFLGIQIDKHLQWNDHFNYVKNKISKCVGILYKLKNCLPRSALLTLYNSLILPYLSYCLPVWGNSNQYKLNSILKLQKKAVRICTGSHHRSHSAPLFKQLNILQFQDLYSYHTAILGFFYFKNLLPLHIMQMFNINSSIHHYETRRNHDFHLFKVNSSFTQRSIRFSFPVVWNSLPNNIKSCQTLRLFKKFYKRLLLLNYF